jgi:ubiquinone/menaquinone biosynthesis C-methylase UbiE
MLLNLMMPTDLPPVCDYEGSDYQSSFWDQGERAYEDQVEAIALQRLLPRQGDFLLEVGAGAGRNTPRYAGFKRVALVDYSLTQLQQARQRLGGSAGYIYVAANAYRLPFRPGIFDAATMIRTLHHMADPLLALQQVRLAMQPGGAFILEYANKHNLKAILRYLLRRQAWSPFSHAPVEFAALNFDFHPAAVQNWLQQASFVIERQLTVSHFRIGLLKRILPLKLLVSMDALAQLSGDWWQLSPSVFLRARALGVSQASPAEVGNGESEIFRCPACGQGLSEPALELLTCQACSKSWRMIDGIYDFRESASG